MEILKMTGCWQTEATLAMVVGSAGGLLYAIVSGSRGAKKVEAVAEVQEKHVSYIQVEEGSTKTTCERRLTVGWGGKEKVTVAVDAKLYNLVRHAGKVLVTYEENRITKGKKNFAVTEIKLP
ncbi:MAG: hypothetical protein UT41_C0001G0024 [Candidatus Wolfebacteria bacterium GW2011_GWC2_39_22]|uniref:Uncharacterized protein n=1 Tax=Candidatus Wolfebacteria bacterium GW2011_GWC2_39_22 TaxID=1619013 RepID=A0A0G0QPZ7_9BACT|nr:MAG: hypothetical protein UT41_C0001G0024 [Candidatus Wolfebacteria bacterium GW2011_GWC2_39_22]HBI25841.1 hypothetical protein [Candidatus Wolfebacteria bacterium]